jgi:hypothetical protein
MAENLPVKCTLKKLGKTYNHLGKEIITAIVMATTLCLAALPGMIVVALAVYGYIITVGVAMAPYLQVAPQPSVSLVSTQFVGFMATLLLGAELLWVCATIMYVSLMWIYKRMGILDLINKISDWCDDYSPITKAAKEKAELEDKTPELIEKPTYDNAWAKSTLIEVISTPGLVALFVTQVLLFVIARLGIQTLITGTTMIKIMLIFAPQTPPESISALFVVVGAVFIGVATLLITEPLVKCLCTNLNVDKFVQEPSENQ